MSPVSQSEVRLEDKRVGLDDFVLDKDYKDLVLYLPLWYLDGNSFKDRSHYGRLVTRAGALWGPQGTGFDGTDDDLQSALVSLPSSTSITIESVVNFDTLTSYRSWISFGGISIGGFFIQREGIANKLRFAWSVAEAADNYYDGPVFTTTGKPVFVSATVLAGVPQCFRVDGVETAMTRGIGSASFSFANPQTIYIGQRGDSTQWMDGIVSEAIIYMEYISYSAHIKHYLEAKRRMPWL